MITVIFKSNKKAKIYSILSKEDCGIYEKGEFIASVETDDIHAYLIDKHDFTFKEVFVSI